MFLKLKKRLKTADIAKVIEKSKRCIETPWIHNKEEAFLETFMAPSSDGAFFHILP